MAQYEQNKDKEILVQGQSENEAKTFTCCYMPHSAPLNLFVAENTYISFGCVCSFKGALLYEVFQHRHASST